MSLLTNNVLRIAAPLIVVLFVVLTLSLRDSAFTLWLQEEAQATDAPSPSLSLRFDSFPDTILWAWERPETLDYIDIERIGVAYLAKTIQFRDNQLFIRPRLQPLTLRPGTQVIAVVRIEAQPHEADPLLGSQVEEAAKEIAEVAQISTVSAVQIDFDARASERFVYRTLLFRVRELLPPTMPLSITALASWCAGDNWLSDLPVDEIVPMLFRLGVNRDQFTSRVQAGEELFGEPCTLSAGVSTDEKIHPPKRKRLYIFSPKPWTQSAVADALETYQR